MKKDDFIKVIRAIVKQEIKKELPIALAQVFQNLMTGNQIVSKTSSIPTSSPVSKEDIKDDPEDAPEDDMTSLKGKLKEMLNNGSMQKQPQQTTPQTKKFSHNPIINEILNETAHSVRSQPPIKKQPLINGKKFSNNPILNEVLIQTTPFDDRERMANRVGGVSPAVMMAAHSYSPPQEPIVGVGDMMSEEELGFLNKIPSMPGAS